MSNYRKCGECRYAEAVLVGRHCESYIYCCHPTRVRHFHFGETRETGMNDFKARSGKACASFEAKEE